MGENSEPYEQVNMKQQTKIAQAGAAYSALIDETGCSSALHYILESGQVLFIQTDDEARVRHCNKAFRHTFAIATEHTGFHLFDYLQPLNQGRLSGGYGQQPGLPAVFTSSRTSSKFLFQVYENNDQYYLFGIPEQADENVQASLLSDLTSQMGNLVQELKRVNRKLLEANRHIEQIAQTDELTGLYNRRYFLQRLVEEIAHAERHHRSLSLVGLDVDGFKAVNDDLGHLAGDALLTQIGAILKSLSRTSDIATRQGGDEFSIVLPDTGLASSLMFAERVRQSIRDNCNLEQELAISASIGVAEFEPGEDINQFLHRVDMAMYQAKKTGKDKVCCYQQ